MQRPTEVTLQQDNVAAPIAALHRDGGDLREIVFFK